MTVSASRELVAELREEGCACPTCGQLARVWTPKIDAGMARTLIVVARHSGGRTFVHVPTLQKEYRSDFHKVSEMAWWGLVEAERELRPDGGRKGCWRATQRGIDFVNRLCTVPRKVRIYDAVVIGQEVERVTIDQCLGDRFNYAELMYGGHAPQPPAADGEPIAGAPPMPGQLALT